MGSKFSRLTEKASNKQLSASLEGSSRQDPYQFLSSDIPEKRKQLKFEQQQQRLHKRQSSYTKPLRTMVGTDGHVWFY